MKTEMFWCFKFGAIIFCSLGIMGTPLEATSADYYRKFVSYDWSSDLWKWLARRKEFSNC